MLGLELLKCYLGMLTTFSSIASAKPIIAEVGGGMNLATDTWVIIAVVLAQALFTMWVKWQDHKDKKNDNTANQLIDLKNLVAKIDGKVEALMKDGKLSQEDMLTALRPSIELLILRTIRDFEREAIAEHRKKV